MAVNPARSWSPWLTHSQPLRSLSPTAYAVMSRAKNGSASAAKSAQLPLHTAESGGVSARSAVSDRMYDIIDFIQLPIKTPAPVPAPPPLPVGARATSMLTADNKHPLIKLEVISEIESMAVRVVEGTAVLYNLVYLAVVTCLARYRWGPDSMCLPSACDRHDFRVVVWWNFITIALFTTIALLFFIYFVYLIAFVVDNNEKHRHTRHPVIWATVLIMPTVISWNNALVNGDRIQVLWRFGGGLSATMSFMRYIIVAFAASAAPLYLILKFGCKGFLMALQ
jgi:hypothetical protein